MTHFCPGCRVVEVPDATFACFICWSALPREIRLPIIRTARMSLFALPRRQAVEAARDYWREKRKTA